MCIRDSHEKMRRAYFHRARRSLECIAAIGRESQKSDGKSTSVDTSLRQAPRTRHLCTRRLDNVRRHDRARDAPERPPRVRVRVRLTRTRRGPDDVVAS